MNCNFSGPREKFVNDVCPKCGKFVPIPDPPAPTAAKQTAEVQPSRPTGWIVVLVLLLVLCVGGIVYFLVQQSKAKELVRQLGGTYSSTSVGGDNIETINLAGSRVADSHLTELAWFPLLDVLVLSDTAVTDEGVAVIVKKFPKLRELDLAGTKVTDRSLRLLKDLPELRELKLAGTEVTDRAVIELEDALPNLQVSGVVPDPVARAEHLFRKLGGRFEYDVERRAISLNLANTRVADKEMIRLLSFPDLKSLNLRQTPAADTGIVHVAKLKHLERLILSDTQVTNGSMAAIATLTQLAELDLSGLGITDKGLQDLVRLPALASLNLDRSYVTQEGIACLKQVPTLSELSLADTTIDDESLPDLGAITDLERLNLKGTRITGTALAGLGQLEKLRRLELERTSVTFADAMRFLVTTREVPEALRILNCAETNEFGEATSVDTGNLSFSDDAIELLGELPKVTKLDLSGTSVTGTGLAMLPKNVPNLVALDLTGLSIKDEDLVPVQKLAALTNLKLENTSVTDEGVVQLEHVRPNLTVTGVARDPRVRARFALRRVGATVTVDENGQVSSIKIPPSELGRESLHHVVAFPELENLDVAGVGLTDEHLASFGDLAELRVLSLSDNDVSDEGLRSLASCTSLESLSLLGTLVTEAGVVSLREDLPDLRVNGYLRIWTNSEGTSQIEAALVNFQDGNVTLRKRDGTTSVCGPDRFSQADRDWLKEQQQGE